MNETFTTHDGCSETYSTNVRSLQKRESNAVIYSGEDNYI